MPEFKVTKAPATMIAIASACARFTAVGTLVSGVTRHQCFEGRRFIMSGLLDSSWEFSVVVQVSEASGEIFNFDPPVFDQRVRAKFSQRLIPPGAYNADWASIELWVEYSPLDGITIKADRVEPLKIICPSTAELLCYVGNPEFGATTEPFDAKIRGHIATCDTCRQFVDEAQADPNFGHLKP